MIEDEKTIAIVDAMAKELRTRMQDGKHATPLKDWSGLPNSTKKKWLEHARALYAIAVAVAQT